MCFGNDKNSLFAHFRKLSHSRSRWRAQERICTRRQHASGRETRYLFSCISDANSTRVTTGYDVFMRSYYKITHKPIYMTEYGVSSSVSTRSLKVSSAGPVHNWMGDRLALPGAVYTRTCVQRCRVVGLREPRKSDCSSDRPRVRRKRTWMDVGAVSIRRDPRKSTMCEYLAHKAIHSFIHSKRVYRMSKTSQLYLILAPLHYYSDYNTPKA